MKMGELETKLERKKEKIRGLVFELEEKDQDAERMKEEVGKLKDKVKI